VSEFGSEAVLVQLGAGIGNVVLATPLLVALNELQVVTDVLLVADYSQTASLLQPWSCVREVITREAPDGYTHVIPGLPPFYHPRFGRSITRRPNTLARPPDSLFYINEQEFYLHFAYVLGYPTDRHPRPTLPIAPSEACGVTRGTVVLAPGCKTGLMATKRWPYFPDLAAELPDVVVVGTPDDLTLNDGAPMNFPAHVRSLVGQLSLRETAEVMAAAGVVVGNDSGLSHVAAAVGTPAVMLFGPTSSKSLGPMPANVKVLRSGLQCEPCWFRNRFQACTGKIDCLASLSVESAIREVFSCLS
jgi:ADP-heptose:LPS heptosyltransferase